MKLGCVDKYQNFRANSENNSNRKSFMGTVADTVSGVTDTITDAADTFANVAAYSNSFANFPKIDIDDAFASPEKLPVDLIESNVIDNEKAPSMLRKAATYLTTVLAAGIAFFAASKTPYTAKTFTKNILSKSVSGTKMLNNLVSIKHSFSDLANNFGLEPVKKFLGKTNNFFEEKLPQKITNILKRGAEITRLDKLKLWTIDDYAKNIFATIMGYKAGKKFYDRQSGKDFMNPITAGQPPKTGELEEAA